MANGACVDPARSTLEFADDLHGTDLRRAGDRAAGKERTHHVLEPHIGPELRSDARRHLRHGAVGLHREQVGYLDRADPRHPTEIVAQKVDDHEILGWLLLVQGEPGLGARILTWGAAARRGALHGTGRHVLALAAEEQLGGKRQNIYIAGMGERAGSHALSHAERGVKRYRIAFEGEQIFQREVDLIDLTGSDVVLDLV